MPSSCCAVGCQNRKSTQKDLIFYRIPAGKHPFHKNRRKLWLQALRREDWSEEELKNARLCSAHFRSGKASMDHGSPDFVPSVFSETLAVTASGHSKLERHQRKNGRQESQVTRNPDDGETDAINAAEGLVSLHSQVTDMSVTVQSRGEAGGGVVAHLQCATCGHYSKSHAHQLSHMAASHPAALNSLAMGRLGNILMYQSTARLFHCSSCFFTSRDFTKLYQHIIAEHCADAEEEDDGGGEDKDKAGDEEKPGDEEEESLKRKRSGEAEEEAEVNNDKADGEGPGENMLLFEGGGYRCLICGWKNKLKSLGVNHVVRKHDIPKAFASQAVKRDTAAAMGHGSWAEEEVAAAATTSGLSGDMLREEVEATAKVVRFISNRFVCLMCGWKTKLRGFAISHVVRNHDVERPYSCKDCKRSFFLPSRLQQHIHSAHRPGRYACPFCCFRSHFLGGFRRHCSRCNAREEDGGGGDYEDEGGGDREEEEEAAGEERRGRRRRRATGRAVIVEDDGEEDDDE
ncbi:myeloid zinc finger 1-like isoform X3 [Sphaeramia orbicularis]|uniref:myeloid zinc finger 1-like isoform X3 n=1 Tax=Sphaeramia orbicularis TaxID=375764 RepID=UPI00118037CE|nr:myeloid zinc finger 1-like isoform X3 [Sphaeramia orbicularis]